MNDNRYVMTTGRIIQLEDLDPEEIRLVDTGRRKFSEDPKRSEFSGWWRKEARSQRLAEESPVYRIWQDLEHRLGIAQGEQPSPDLETCVTNLLEEVYGRLDRFCWVEGPERKLVLVRTLDSHTFNTDHIEWLFLFRPVLDEPERKPASVGILIPFRVPYSKCKRHFWRFLDFSQERGRQRLLKAAIEEWSVDGDSPEPTREWQRDLARQIRWHDLLWLALRRELQQDFTRVGKHLGGSRTNPCRRALVEEIQRLVKAGNDEEGSWNVPRLWRYFQQRSRTLKGGFKTSPDRGGISEDFREKDRLKITGADGRSKSITCATFRGYVAEAIRTARAIR